MPSRPAITLALAIMGLTTPLFAQTDGAVSAAAGAAVAGPAAESVEKVSDTVSASEGATVSTSEGGSVSADASAQGGDTAASPKAVPATPEEGADKQDSPDKAATFTVADLIGRPVANAKGRTLGEIKDVVTIRGEAMVILGVGGFLGIGERDVAVPVTELTLRNDMVTAMGYTRAQLKTMSEVRYGLVRSLDRGESVHIGRS